MGPVFLWNISNVMSDEAGFRGGREVNFDKLRLICLLFFEFCVDCPVQLCARSSVDRAPVS